MSREQSGDGFDGTRPVLGDVTNHPRKRDFSLISGNSVPKSGDGSLGNTEQKQEGSPKRVPKLKEGKCLTKCSVVHKIASENQGFDSTHPLCETNSLQGNIASGISKRPILTKEPGSLDGVFVLDRCNALTQKVIEVGDLSLESFASVNSVDSSSLVGVEGKCEINAGKICHDAMPSSSNIYRIDDDDDGDLGVDNLGSSKHGSNDGFGFPESQESRCLEFDKCERQKGDECSYSRAGFDLIRACSCSFCTKAAYIWMNLHYQDMKGRIAVSKKSEREASILVQRNYTKQETQKHGQGSSKNDSKLESELSGQWRSLFLHMENEFSRESSQLEKSLVTLEDLREKLKTELKSDEMRFEKR